MRKWTPRGSAGVLDSARLVRDMQMRPDRLCLEHDHSRRRSAMRATLFLSSLFAVSLVGGVALAERPSEGAEIRRPIRDHKIQELRTHEASTVREHAAPVRQEKASTREPRVVKEAPS